VRSMAGELGWKAWDGIPRLAGGVIAVSVVVGYVALGAGVVFARSLRLVARQTWMRFPALRPARNGTGPH